MGHRGSRTRKDRPSAARKEAQDVNTELSKALPVAKDPEFLGPNECFWCEIDCKTPEALRSHLISNVHQVGFTLCPFCGDRFAKASIFMGHLENGHCAGAPGLNHHSILCLLKDISTPGQLLRWTPCWAQWIEEDMSKPGEDPGHRCFVCFRLFKTRHDLEWHMRFPLSNPSRSPLRQYQCPDSSGWCRKTFYSLTDLFKHLESHACDTMSFEDLQMIQADLTRAFWGWGTRQLW
ncbi:Zinc finger C2H2 type domain-containing protein [Penicillium ucsense]|uniref:Zinc finger C2H2 type domain-containing protein n=1 Tax=Penicillium ucsense TaxID=2839758 RepID=A0A8J8W8D1_9EURO|nr:Zinc finger C2H2 type domain-containing protein [Penicillium ucsense]KAF7738757.1 Zinc finger C2H2 type domain-containing protein [Penicillium ucsense]